MGDLPLGRKVDYPQRYDPALLVAIPRGDNRRKLGLVPGDLPFTGADVWNAYELSWLDLYGKPQVARGRFIFGCDSPNLIESKSLKLYLNSLNQESFPDLETARLQIAADLAAACGAAVEVLLQDFSGMQELLDAPTGVCLDNLVVRCEQYEVQPGLLQLHATEALFEEAVDEVVYTDLFRSRCPITGQPDWATMTISYQGPRIDHASLLRYLVSYRLHDDFHENCVERIYCDIQLLCRPYQLSVEANFLRRGGLDINPVRSTAPMMDYVLFPRYNRQ
ncbi:MAG TPA: NADPH-dependent 7-cyano-7-deazaguanine reductase QueF [Candidatus Acidoferrum sp.]|nr:NADPH-dependent 7-cyano-7-deazaguanine reductase QueF [Candidatus Acidoferrum sp.]